MLVMCNFCSFLCVGGIPAQEKAVVPQVICVKPRHPSSQDRDFVAKQKEDLELAMRKLTTENRREICDKERDCLSKKQELLRGGAQSHPEWWN